jgi:hypothetical protein
LLQRVFVVVVAPLFERRARIRKPLFAWERAGAYPGVEIGGLVFSRLFAGLISKGHSGHSEGQLQGDEVAGAERKLLTGPQRGETTSEGTFANA